MSDIKPQRKTIEYEYLSAYVDYKARTLTITDKPGGESITIPAIAYPELVAIMSDIGHQIPVTGSAGTRR